MPRAAIKSGLPGTGQALFPEAAKEQARRIGLKDEAALIFEFSSEDDGGGDTKTTWKPQAKKVRGRIDPVGTKGTGTSFGAQIDESTTHVITLDPTAKVSSRDRVEIEGVMWTITSRHFVTQGASIQVQVKELRT
jgi:hypothetical protein